MSKYKLGDYTIKNWNDWDRVPRDPVTVGAYIITGAGVSASAVAAMTMTTYLTYYAVGYIATTLVTSALLSALSPKPDMGSAAGSNGLLTNAKGATTSSELVYGQVRKGGTITFLESTGGTENKILHQIIVLAGHEVEEIGDIYFNDEVVSMSGPIVTDSRYTYTTTTRTKADEDAPVVETITNHYVATVYKHTGNQTSATSAFANSSNNLANSLIAETSATSDFVGKNIAYLYCRFEYNQDAFVGGLPTVTAKVKGKKIVKTSSGTEQSAVYTTNTAWVIRDFLTSEYGLNDDQIDYATFEAAADICAETDVLSDGSEQYQVNGVVDLSQNVGDVLTQLVAACGGSLFWGGGYWKLYAGDFITPTKTLTMDDLRSPITLNTKASMRDNFNRVSGTFIDKDNDWVSADYPAIESSVFLADDNNVEATMDLPLPYTTNVLAAQRLAKQMLYRNREQISLSADFGLEALDIEVGDFIKFRNDRYGWSTGSEKTFEVIGWRLNPDADGDIRVNLSLRESSQAAFGFDLSDEQTIISNNSTLLKYYEVPTIGVTVSQEYREVNENVVNALIVSITSNDIDRIDSVILKYRKTSDLEFKSVGQTILVDEGDNAGRFEIVGVDAPQINEGPINYTVSVTPVNGLGFKGDTISTTFNVTADTTPPSSPSSLSHQLSGGTSFFSWPPVSDLDLSHYKLYYSSTTGANFKDASNIVQVDRIARPATSVTAPALAGKYFVSSVDKTGNESTTAATTTILSSELPALGQSDTHTESTGFSGSKTNLTVSSGNLFMTDSSSYGATGTYNFDHNGAGYFDVGTSRTIRLSSAVTFTRKHANASGGQVNWDDIPNNWDTWPDNWDTWTNETANFNDFAVLIQARSATTTGGLSSASYVTATGEVTGRYVQFRAILSNTGVNVTPNITALSATVEY
jgi:hypothetical protein